MTENKFKIIGNQGAEVWFEITKLSALRAWRLLEYIRKTLGSAEHVAGIGGDNAGTDMLMLVTTLMALPEEKIEHIRSVLFENVMYRTASMRGNAVPLVTEGDIDVAFADLEPVHIYEVMGRCLMINFTGSFNAIRSKFPAVGEILSLLNLSTSQHT
jgi:hypothetical protein